MRLHNKEVYEKEDCYRKDKDFNNIKEKSAKSFQHTMPLYSFCDNSDNRDNE